MSVTILQAAGVVSPVTKVTRPTEIGRPYDPRTRGRDIPPRAGDLAGVQAAVLRGSTRVLTSAAQQATARARGMIENRSAGRVTAVASVGGVSVVTPENHHAPASETGGGGGGGGGMQTVATREDKETCTDCAEKIEKANDSSTWLLLLGLLVFGGGL